MAYRCFHLRHGLAGAFFMAFSCGAGLAHAYCPIGDEYFNAKNYDRALGEYRECAMEGGDILSQYALAGMYYKGQGAPQSFPMAVDFFKLASANGYAPAQARFGLLYWRGEGVEKDLAEAYKWIYLAAEKSDNKWYYPAAVYQAVPFDEPAAEKFREQLKASLSPEEEKKALDLVNKWKFERLRTFAKRILNDDEMDMFESRLIAARSAEEVTQLLGWLKGEAARKNRLIRGSVREEGRR